MNVSGNRPVRVMMVIPGLRSGGAEQQLIYLSRGLAEIGYRVTAAVFRKPDEATAVRVRGFSVSHLPGRGNYDPRLFFRLLRAARRFRPDLMQTWNPQTDILGGAVAVSSGIPWVIREPVSAEFYRSGWKPFFRRLLAARAAAVAANSAWGGEYWRGIYPEKMSAVIRNGLPLEAIDRTAPIGRERLGIGPGRKLLLFAGRLTGQKRVDLILEAFSRVCRRADAVLFICGAGEDRARLEELARDRAISGRVRFPGFLPPEEVWGLMKTADLFCNLSGFEGMPNTVMEAMACGTPLLVSDIPTHREFLDERTAGLVEGRDPGAVAEEMNFLLSERSGELRRRRTAEARKMARAWSITEMVGGYDKLYQRILAGGERPGKAGKSL